MRRKSRRPGPSAADRALPSASPTPAAACFHARRRRPAGRADAPCAASEPARSCRQSSTSPASPGSSAAAQPPPKASPPATSPLSGPREAARSQCAGSQSCCACACPPQPPQASDFRFQSNSVPRGAPNRCQRRRHRSQLLAATLETRAPGMRRLPRANRLPKPRLSFRLQRIRPCLFLCVQPPPVRPRWQRRTRQNRVHPANRRGRHRPMCIVANRHASHIAHPETGYQCIGQFGKMENNGRTKTSPDNRTVACNQSRKASRPFLDCPSFIERLADTARAPGPNGFAKIATIRTDGSFTCADDSFPVRENSMHPAVGLAELRRECADVDASLPFVPWLPHSRIAPCRDFGRRMGRPDRVADCGSGAAGARSLDRLVSAAEIPALALGRAKFRRSGLARPAPSEARLARCCVCACGGLRRTGRRSTATVRCWWRLSWIQRGLRGLAGAPSTGCRRVSSACLPDWCCHEDCRETLCAPAATRCRRSPVDCSPGNGCGSSRE